MDGIWVARDKRVPVVERFAFVEQTVGAGFRHEIGDVFHGAGRKLDAFGHQRFADLILAAAAGVVVE